MDDQGRATIKDSRKVKTGSLHFNVELKDVGFQGAQPCGGDDWPETGCKLLQVAVLQEVHTVCARNPG